MLVALVGGGWWWSQRKAQAAEGAFRTAAVERGDIRVAISATGTLSAISTVDVGSQISGQVTAVLVDFNDRGQEGPGDRAHRSEHLPGADRARRGAGVQRARESRNRARHARQRRSRLHAQGRSFEGPVDRAQRSRPREGRARPGARTSRRRAGADHAAAGLDADLATQPGPHGDPLAGRRRGAHAHDRTGPDRRREPAGAGVVPDRRRPVEDGDRAADRRSRHRPGQGRAGASNFTVDAFPDRAFRGAGAAGAPVGDQHEQRDHVSGGRVGRQPR